MTKEVGPGFYLIAKQAFGLLARFDSERARFLPDLASRLLGGFADLRQRRRTRSFLRCAAGIRRGRGCGPVRTHRPRVLTLHLCLLCRKPANAGRLLSRQKVHLRPSVTCRVLVNASQPRRVHTTRCAWEKIRAKPL